MTSLKRKPGQVGLLTSIEACWVEACSHLDDQLVFFVLLLFQRGPPCLPVNSAYIRGCWHASMLSWFYLQQTRRAVHVAHRDESTFPHQPLIPWEDRCGGPPGASLLGRLLLSVMSLCLRAGLTGTGSNLLRLCMYYMGWFSLLCLCLFYDHFKGTIMTCRRKRR